jgi:hypothetical protein
MAEHRHLRDPIEAVEPLVQIGCTIPAFNSEKHDLSVLATALLRKAWVQANAIGVITASGHPEAGLPNFRTMLEAWGELQHLFADLNPVRRARVAHLYALREFQLLAKKFEEPDDVAALQMELDRARKNVPDVFTEAMQLKPGGCWPAVGRGVLIEGAIDFLAFDGAGELQGKGTGIYKLLSLEEHHVLAGLTGIQLNPGLPAYGTIKAPDGPHEPEIFIPLFAAGVLAAMLVAYEKVFPR